MKWPQVQLDAEQTHTMPLKGKHAEFWCQDCHNDERKPDDACSCCYQRPHDWGDETCDSCHLPDGWVPARNG